jgi:tripartite-type tricarboxylate transporter receptor subunit TctC
LLNCAPKSTLRDLERALGTVGGRLKGTSMPFSRRQFLHVAAAAATPLVLPRIAIAQGYPTRYVRLVVPFPPGGAADPIARILGNRLSEVWGQQVVIENKAGAGGNLAAQSVAQSAPDGYTLLIVTSFLATNPYLYPTLGYDPAVDLAPVSRVCGFPNVMVVPSSSSVQSVGDFVDHARANRGKITFASSGTGTSVHLAGELFKRMAKIEMTHVPYRGAGPALNDLMPGRVDVMFATLPSVLSLIRTGSLRALALTTAERSSFAPDVPTIAESGVRGFDMSEWFALFAPVRTPDEIVRRVHDDVVAALGHPPVKQRMSEIAASVMTSTPAELSAFLKQEMDKWGPVIRDANINAE